MFRPPLSNPTQKRTLKPLLANTQATPTPGFLDPAWAKTFDILPGTVMKRKYGEVFEPSTAAGDKHVGLSAMFVAPVMGIDEVASTGTNLFTVWLGDNQSQFEVLAPAFDTAATWPSTSGPAAAAHPLYLTANAQGKLTPTGATAGNAAATLIDVVSATKIIVSPIGAN
jgi:hypothetical protein